ncbi:unnamed protein product [Prorocentrum cordatum]|uniref:Uncharacterized protein n=1 Tax=Prorocentrum cordatum TaxID=2364126 RepID=A0ABN9X287_9DINO|nr:unnamed protein product [Polarella glacialis]
MPQTYDSKYALSVCKQWRPNLSVRSSVKSTAPHLTDIKIVARIVRTVVQAFFADPAMLAARRELDPDGPDPLYVGSSAGPWVAGDDVRLAGNNGPLRRSLVFMEQSPLLKVVQSKLCSQRFEDVVGATDQLSSFALRNLRHPADGALQMPRPGATPEVPPAQGQEEAGEGAPGVLEFKAAARCPWCCKSCSAPDAKGFRKLNFGERLQCKWCNMPKSTHFCGKPEHAAPSRSSAEVKLAQVLDQLRMFKAAAGQPGPGGAADPKRRRLEQLEKQLGEIRRRADMEDEVDDFVETARNRMAELEAEREQLRQEVFLAKPKDVQLKSLADQIKKLEKQQDKGREEMEAVAAKQKELEAKADALRLADVEREARLVELRAEQPRALGKLAQPPAVVHDGLEGEIEVEGLEFSADFLGKVLGSFGVDGALHASLLGQATKFEQQCREARAAEAAAAAAVRAAERAGVPGAGSLEEGRVPIPGEGVPAGCDAVDDEEPDVDAQLSFLTKVGAAPAGAEGSDRPADDDVREAFKRFHADLDMLPPKWDELCEADEQAALDLGDCISWGTGGCPSQGGQVQSGRSAAGAAGGTVLGRQHAGEPQARGAGAAFGRDGNQQAPSGLLGVFGFQGCGPRMSESADQMGQPQVSASGHGLHDVPGGMQPLEVAAFPRMDYVIGSSLEAGELEIDEFDIPAGQEGSAPGCAGPPCDRGGQRAPMVKGGCCLVTANVTSRGPLNEYLVQADGQTTLALAVQEHHCVAGSGSKIDYFVVSKSLAGFTAAPPRLYRGASTWPHWPVHLPLRSVRVEAWHQVLDEPRAVPREPAKPGCARGPWRWKEVTRCVQATHDDQGLQIIWDLLREGVETEILNRRDLVGPARRAFAGRGTSGAAAGLKWEVAQWRPPLKRKLRGPEAHAWAALAGWASELLSKRDRQVKLLEALDSRLRPPWRTSEIRDHVHWRSLPPRTQLPFRADANWTEDGFEQGLKRALAEAKERQRKMVQAGEARWKEWVDDAFLGGAGAAHAASKVPVLQEVLPAIQEEGSAALVDREMKPWIDIWNYHGLTSMELPSDAHLWDARPPRQLHDIRDVLRSFPWRTGVGQSGIPPRALEDLSDDALHAMIAVFHKCEELLARPSGRLINTMVRLPKPDGGSRLIGLMPTLVGVWSRARRPITKVALDLWKAYEMAAPEAQLVEARALGFPMRLAWMLLSSYRQPRTLAAFNTTSDLFVAWQGNIAGCGHANSLLLVLTLRALQRAHTIAPSVTPRGLVHDVTLDWSGPRGEADDSLAEAPRSFASSMVELRLVMQPQKSGYLASSRRRARLLAHSMQRAGLAEKFWVRNLGHELHGRKVPRTQEKRRLQALAARRSRVAMLRRAAGRRATALVATGLSPSAGHGAGVAGLADRPLAQLWTVAAVTAGAKAGCGSAAVMLLQRRVDYDPIYAATIPLVMRLASRIWEGRGSLASLNASWCKLAEAMRAGTLTWATAHGPLGATWLTLGRIGWTMTAAWALQSDLGETLPMLRVAPRGIKDALVEGIPRWQCRRLVAHLPEGQGGVGWGGHFTNAWRHARGYTASDLCRACGGAKDTLMHRWCACPALVAPRGDELKHEEPLRKPIAAMRHQLEEAEQKWTIGDSELTLAYGLPLMPALPPPAPSDNVVIEWGATQEEWPSVVYTDGSGHASRVPEARRCGWAAVALRPDGIPLKAAYGPLPGPRQTVGRAERRACLAPLAQAGLVQVIVSDLQSLVTEGNGWSPSAQPARARHVSIWRQLHAAAAKRGGPPPRFRWAPAHRTLQQAPDEGLRPLDWLGNCWADFFANLGAAVTRLPNNTAEALRAELKRALDTATCLGWAAARICQLDLWKPLGEDGKPQRRQVWREPAAPKLSLTRHEYQVTSSVGVQRVHCGREAYTAKARELLDCKPCQPTELGRMRARCRQGRPMASPAAASLQAAERLEEEELLPMSGAAAATQGQSQKWTMQQKVNYLLEAAKGTPAEGTAGAAAAGQPQAQRGGRPEPRPGPGRGLASTGRRVGLERPREGNDRRAIEAWDRSGPLEAALGLLASSWVADLMGQSLAYASWMEERVEYVYKMLGEEVDRGFFMHNCAETRNAERLRRAEEFCERGWWDGGPFREPHIDEALQLEGEDRQIKLLRLRCYHAAARAFLCDRGSARRAGGRRGPLYFTFFEPVGRSHPLEHNESESNSSPEPDAVFGLEALRCMLRAFASCWVFDLRDSEAAESTWPGREETREEATRLAGSIGLRARVQAIVRQAWLMEADVRRFTVEHLMDMATLEEWLHFAAMQWATLDEVCHTMEDVIGEAVVNLPGLPGFAGPLPGLGPSGTSEQPPRQAGLPRPQGIRSRGIEALRRLWPGTWQRPGDPGSGSGGEHDLPHPDAAPSGLPPPPPAAAAGQMLQQQPAGAAQGVQGEAAAEGDGGPRLDDGGGEAAAARWAEGLPVAAACAVAAAVAAATEPDACGGGAQGPHKGARAAQRSRSPARAAGPRTPRGGVQLPEAHHGHGVRIAGPYAFCCRCGAFSKLEGVDRAKGLKAVRGGSLPPGPQATAGEKKKRLYLSRLLGGKDPYTGRPLG